MREPVYGKANPVDSLHNNQYIRVCFDQYAIPKPLTCGEPVEIVAQAPVGIVQNTTANLWKINSSAKEGKRRIHPYLVI